MEIRARTPFTNSKVRHSVNGRCSSDRASVEKRFWPKVKKQPSGCWLWTGALSVGYGVIGVGTKLVKAHRLSYEWQHGPIPRGLTLDHLCRVPACVNPQHLEPVSHKENILRGNGRAAVNARRPACPCGQPYFVVPFTKPNGTKAWQRRCRACSRRTDLRRYYRRRDQLKMEA